MKSIKQQALQKPMVLHLSTAMNRMLAFAYGAFSYAAFFGVFLYMIGFVGNLVGDAEPGDPPRCHQHQKDQNRPARDGLLEGLTGSTDFVHGFPHVRGEYRNDITLILRRTAVIHVFCGIWPALGGTGRQKGAERGVAGIPNRGIPNRIP